MLNSCVKTFAVFFFPDESILNDSMLSKDEEEDEDPLDFNEDLLCDHCKSFTLHVFIPVITCDIAV